MNLYGSNEARYLVEMPPSGRRGIGHKNRSKAHRGSRTALRNQQYRSKMGAMYARIEERAKSQGIPI